MNGSVSPLEVAASLTELWSPRVIGELDDNYIKAVKIQGEFPWHTHDGEDELFYVLQGSLVLEFEDLTLHLQAGELFVVPKGVLHRPVAVEECLVMLIEKKSTLHTGGVDSAMTKSIDEQLRR